MLARNDRHDAPSRGRGVLQVLGGALIVAGAAASTVLVVGIVDRLARSPSALAFWVLYAIGTTAFVIAALERRRSMRRAREELLRLGERRGIPYRPVDRRP